MMAVKCLLIWNRLCCFLLHLLSLLTADFSFFTQVTKKRLKFKQCLTKMNTRQANLQGPMQNKNAGLLTQKAGRKSAIKDAKI